MDKERIIELEKIGKLNAEKNKKWQPRSKVLKKVTVACSLIVLFSMLIDVMFRLSLLRYIFIGFGIVILMSFFGIYVEYMIRKRQKLCYDSMVEILLTSIKKYCTVVLTSQKEVEEAMNFMCHTIDKVISGKECMALLSTVKPYKTQATFIENGRNSAALLLEILSLPDDEDQIYGLSREGLDKLYELKNKLFTFELY